jgi:hypothetical protein
LASGITRCSISLTASRAALLTAGLGWVLLTPAPAGAYETDQFSHRLTPIADSTALLDGKVNETIRDIAANWRGPRNDWKFVDAVFHRIGGYYWVDKIEAWAMKSPDVERLQTSRRDSIYKGHPFWATRVASLFGVGPTIKVNGQLIGSDKLGHFLSQGRKFYRRYLASLDEAQAAEQSAFTERALFGQMTTGVYSNADLVANYEGYRFYRSLFEDGINGDKPAILAWRDGRWIVQRAFTFADHVNEYWDEALNVNHFDRILYPYMKARLETFCPDYRKAPGKYVIRDEEKLRKRYAPLQLRDTSELRLDHLCREEAAPAVRGVAGRPD